MKKVTFEKKTDISRIWLKTKSQETLEFKLKWQKEPTVENLLKTDKIQWCCK